MKSVIACCLALALLGGCTSVERSTRLFEHAAVSDKAGTSRRVIEGDSLVLERSEWSSPRIVILPDMISGYALDVVLSQEALVKGNKVDCPSRRCVPHLLPLTAPNYHTYTDVTGTLRISDVTREGARVEVDLRSAGADWALSVEDFYRYAPRSCVGMVDWACQFYSK